MSRGPLQNNYFARLTGDDRGRYATKVALCGGLDPFEEEDIGSEKGAIPDVSREDIVDYLVLRTDFYTLQHLKNYKTLEAHNFLTSGHIKSVSLRPLQENQVLVFGRIVHSQRLNDQPAKCWLLLKMNGEVVTGHCNCMAGNGSTCSHVGAVLFFLEFFAAKKRATTCTSELNKWLQPASVSSAPMRMIEETDLRAARTKFTHLLEGRTTVKKAKPQRPTATTQELTTMLQAAKDAGVECAVFHVWEGFQSLDTSSTSEITPLHSRLSTELCARLPYSQLLTYCDNVFQTITITKDEALHIEMLTRGQSNNEWMEHRAGRITASRMKDVCRTNVDKPSVSLIKAICYPAAQKFSTVHTRRGISDEPVIVEEFADIMLNQHDGFEILKCGLVVNPRYPFLGASPDALFTCTCHVGGVVEVKSISVDESQNTGLSNGKLDRFHKFSYQIQTQMLVCQLRLGYFVEKKPNGLLHIEMVEPDEDIRSEILAKTIPFYKKAILPELVCKYFSAERHILDKLDIPGNVTPLSICICKEPPSPPMINCAGRDCPIVTFHKKCVGITRNLKKWTCVNCHPHKPGRSNN